MNKEPLLTISQVASFLQVAEETVRRYVRSGNLKHIKLGRQIRFKSEHINDFLNSFADVGIGEQPEAPEDQSITQDAEQNEQLDLFDGEYQTTLGNKAYSVPKGILTTDISTMSDDDVLSKFGKDDLRNMASLMGMPMGTTPKQALGNIRIAQANRAMMREITAEQLNNMKSAELKDLAKKLRLSAFGNKPQLVERLNSWYPNQLRQTKNKVAEINLARETINAVKSGDSSVINSPNFSKNIDYIFNRLDKNTAKDIYNAVINGKASNISYKTSHEIENQLKTLKSIAASSSDPFERQKANDLIDAIKNKRANIKWATRKNKPVLTEAPATQEAPVAPATQEAPVAPAEATTQATAEPVAPTTATTPATTPAQETTPPPIPPEDYEQVAEEGEEEPPVPEKPVKAEIKKSPLQKALDYVSTMLFDKAEALQNDIIRSAKAMGLSTRQIRALTFASGLEQAGHFANLAGQGVKMGGLRFNPDTQILEAYIADNIRTVEDRLAAVGAANKTSFEEARRTFNDLAIYRRVAEILQSAAVVLKDAAYIKATQPKADYDKYIANHAKQLKLAKIEASAFLEREGVESVDPINDALELIVGKTTRNEKGEEQKVSFGKIGEISAQYPNPADPKNRELTAFDGDNSAYAAWQTVRENTLKFMTESGRISRRDAENLLDAAFYVPFYRVMEADNMEDFIQQVAGRTGGLLANRKLYKMKGSKREVKDILENMEQWQAAMLGMSARNHKQLQMIDSAMAVLPEGSVVQRKGAGRNTIMTYRNGRPEYYQFAEPLHALALMGSLQINMHIFNFMRPISEFLRKSIVLNPLFTLAQLPQDTYAAMMTAGLRNPFALPIEVVKQFTQNAVSVATGKEPESKARAALMRSGFIGLDYSAAVVNQQTMEALGLRKGPEKGRDWLKRKVEEFSAAGDAAVRQAIYERTVRELKGNPDAEAIAIRRAADVINFRRQGASTAINMLRQVVPFYGALLQAQRVMLHSIAGRGLAYDTRSQNYKRLMANTVMLMGMGLLYAMVSADDDELKEMDPSEKDNKLFPFGAGAGLSIPLRKDWTLIPHMVANHAYNALVANTEDPETAKKAFSNLAIAQMVGIVPVPTAARPVLEIGLNKDFFTLRDIEGPAMQALNTELRFTKSTSELGKWLGNYGISPIVFDHFVRGYTGSLGGAALTMANAAFRYFGDVPYVEQPMYDTLQRSVPGISAFMSKSEHTGSEAAFHDLQNDAMRALRTANSYAKVGVDVESKLTDKELRMVQPAVRSMLSRKQDSLTKIRQEESVIRRLPNSEISPKEKAEQIEQLKAAKKDTLADIQQLRNYVYRGE